MKRRALIHPIRINEWTAEAIMRDLEPILGKDWWRQ